MLIFPQIAAATLLFYNFDKQQYNIGPYSNLNFPQIAQILQISVFLLAYALNLAAIDGMFFTHKNSFRFRR